MKSYLPLARGVPRTTTSNLSANKEYMKIGLLVGDEGNFQSDSFERLAKQVIFRISGNRVYSSGTGIFLEQSNLLKHQAEE